MSVRVKDYALICMQGYRDGLYIPDDCPTEAELMKKIVEHAKSVHKIDPVSSDLIVKIKKAIKK